MVWKHFLNRPFCIYGAGIVAMSVYTAIEALFDQRPLFFLTSDPETLEKEPGKSGGVNTDKINGIPLKSLSEWKYELQENKPHAVREKDFGRLASEPDTVIPELYLVATPEIHHTSIVKNLHVLQIKDENIFLFTNTQENNLLEAYYNSLGSCRTVKSILISERIGNLANKNTDFDDSKNKVALRVYQAKSHMDKPLHGQYFSSEVPAYIFPIQVGTALTNQVICTFQDNIGDNISAKNRNYCELTATYHAWKHSDALYKGICHYRRIFDISDQQMQELLEAADRWDVILPYPSVHYPDISTQHTRYVKEDDWNAMLHALEELEPEYLKAYEKRISLRERFFYNYNMLIAKSEVFDDYCSFLFKILERTEELVTPKGWERADRFAGYLGENLTTIYFMKNRQRWKIAHAGKIWMT